MPSLSCVSFWTLSGVMGVIMPPKGLLGRPHFASLVGHKGRGIGLLLQGDEDRPASDENFFFHSQGTVNGGRTGSLNPNLLYFFKNVNIEM